MVFAKPLTPQAPMSWVQFPTLLKPELNNALVKFFKMTIQSSLTSIVKANFLPLKRLFIKDTQSDERERLK